MHLIYDDRTAQVDHTEEWEAVYFPLGDRFDPGAGIAVDHDPRDLRSEPPDGATYALTEAPIDSKKFFSEAASAIRDYLYRQRSVTIYRNRSLKLYGRVGESEEGFAARCRDAADTEADRDLAKVKDRFENRIRKAKQAIEDAYLDVETAKLDAETRRQEEVVSGAATVIGILTGRRSSRSMSTAAGKRSMTRKAEQRVKKAEAKVSDKVEDLDELEQDVEEAAADVLEEWSEKAADIETLEIGLEKSDISVEDPVLVWIPVA